MMPHAYHALPRKRDGWAATEQRPTHGRRAFQEHGGTAVAVSGSSGRKTWPTGGDATVTTTFQCRTLCNKHYERNANATVNSAYADMNEQCRTYEQCLILTYVDDVDIWFVPAMWKISGCSLPWTKSTNLVGWEPCDRLCRGFPYLYLI